MKNKPYRVSDSAGNKVHSIQIGNVLQIVPTEVQPLAPSQQKVIFLLPIVNGNDDVGRGAVVDDTTLTYNLFFRVQVPSPQVSMAAASHATMPPNSQHVNTLSSGHVQNVTGLSSILSAHLPGSFAAAPAVSGSKSNAVAPRVCNESPIKEQRLAPNDPRQKPKDPLPPPLPGNSNTYLHVLI